MDWSKPSRGFEAADTPPAASTRRCEIAAPQLELRLQGFGAGKVLAQHRQVRRRELRHGAVPAMLGLLPEQLDRFAVGPHASGCDELAVEGHATQSLELELRGWPDVPHRVGNAYAPRGAKSLEAQVRRRMIAHQVPRELANPHVTRAMQCQPCRPELLGIGAPRLQERVSCVEVR